MNEEFNGNDIAPEIGVDYILDMHNITKSFPGVKALQNVSFKAYPGKVNVLLGENGAGKSTLMKILAGVIPGGTGRIAINKQEVSITHPIDATKAGIAMIHQELNLVPYMSIAENIFLGREPGASGVVDRKRMFNDTVDIIKRVGFEASPSCIVEDLSTGLQQMVEIAKAISLGARIIIMDEPTSSLSDHEVRSLFSLIEKLKEQNVAIIYISHRLDEIFEIGDTITILRDGTKVGDFLIKNINRTELIKHMVGREITALFPRTDVAKGEKVLEVNNISKEGLYRNISFDLQKGEILGFFGLIGAGRSEIVHGIFGSDPIDSGDIIVRNQNVRINSPGKAMKLRIGLVPEDRKLQGLNIISSIAENMTITVLDDICSAGSVIKRKETSLCRELISKLRISTPSMNQIVNNLSGGNQQKVVLAKWIARNIDILILDEPTRGVDVGAKVEIHKLMNELTEQGVAVIMISSELPEILGMSDRICVIHEGCLEAVLDKDEADQELIMHHATGSKE